MINHMKIQQNIENEYDISVFKIKKEYEAQQLNEFYNQENEDKKDKLQKIRDNYYLQKIISIKKMKEKVND